MTPRAMALSAKQRGWARAVRGLGGGPVRLYARHILPNIAGVIVVNATATTPATAHQGAAAPKAGPIASSRRPASTRLPKRVKWKPSESRKRPVRPSASWP